MTLAAGTRLGPYEILSPLGAGGMGAVYSARDTRLQREVAIKVLPAEHTSDPARRQRLLREAQAVSALNHPNIVTLHDVGESEGIAYLVMERVSGRTLDQVIPHGGLRLAETLRLAMQIADGLGNAHGAGILHRDLKPGNVMVTEDGTAKLLDFGLAKLVQADEAGPASADGSTATAVGTIAGTVAYMSPEQAQGKALDARSDIFSFGAVLYEMATGRRAFKGDSTPAVLAAVIAEEPRAPRELQGDIPRDLERIIQRCLRKDPARRFHNISDVKVELLELKEDSDSQAATGAASTVLGASATRRPWRRIALIGAAVAIVAGGAVAVWRAARVERPAPTVVQLTSERYVGGGAFSPDGTQIAFVSSGDIGGNADIWVKLVGEAEARRLTDHTARIGWLAWSPDGRQIAFLRYPDPLNPGAIFLVSPMGGAERRLADLPVGLANGGGGQLSWSADGHWLAAGRNRGKGETAPGSGGIHLIPAGGGPPRAITFPEAPAYDGDPAFSPDGRGLAYATCTDLDMPACNVNVLFLDAGLQPAGASRRLPGPPVRVQGVVWARDGRSIVYGVNEIPNTYLWRVAADGSAPPQRVELAGRGARGPSIARGRDRLAFTRTLWDDDIYRLRQGTPPAPLLASTFPEWYPQYSPDGRRIAFQAGRSGDAMAIWLSDADGSGATRLTRGPGRSQGTPRWSPDGRSIAFDEYNEQGRFDIWTTGVDGAGLRQVTRDPANDNMPSWSRDGHFIYYGSNRTGRYEVWRVPVAGGAEEQITRDGGCVPFEAFDGRTLYYMRSCDNAALLARPLGGGTERELFRCVDERGYAVGPQGILHVDCKSPDDPLHHVVRLWDATTGQDRPVGTFESAWTAGLAVSPDGKDILFGRSMMNSELMMIENFR